MNKAQLRKQFLAKRDRLAPAARIRDSAIIRQRLFKHPWWQDAHTILTYVSCRSEVDTHKLIQEALTQSKRVVVPVVNAQKKEIELSELRAWGDLAPGPFYGIYEPAERLKKWVDPSDIELVVAPGAGFDRQGGRIGLGGGYFDKLLAKMPNAQRIGLAFSTQISKPLLPMEAHDKRMQVILTEKEVISLEK